MPHRQVDIHMKMTEPGFFPASPVGENLLLEILNHIFHLIMEGNSIVSQNHHPGFRRTCVGKKQIELSVMCLQSLFCQRKCLRRGNLFLPPELTVCVTCDVYHLLLLHYFSRILLLSCFCISQQLLPPMRFSRTESWKDRHIRELSLEH